MKVDIDELERTARVGGETYRWALTQTATRLQLWLAMP